MYRAAISEGETGAREHRGWPAIKQILADFLLVFFGSWLLARATADWIKSGRAFDEVSGLMIAWMVIETILALLIVALGIDMWRRHSRESGADPSSRADTGTAPQLGASD